MIFSAALSALFAELRGLEPSPKPKDEPVSEPNDTSSIGPGQDTLTASAQFTLTPEPQTAPQAEPTVSDHALAVHRSAEALHVLIDEIEKRLFPDALAVAGPAADLAGQAIHTVIADANGVLTHVGDRLRGVIERI